MEDVRDEMAGDLRDARSLPVSSVLVPKDIGVVVPFALRAKYAGLKPRAG
jgi:hypothetical protein